MRFDFGPWAPLNAPCFADARGIAQGICDTGLLCEQLGLVDTSTPTVYQFTDKVTNRMVVRVHSIGRIEGGMSSLRATCCHSNHSRCVCWVTWMCSKTFFILSDAV